MGIDPSPLGPLVSDELATLASQLLRLPDASTKKPCTVEQIQTRKKKLQESEEKLHNARLDLALAVSRIQEAQREIADTSIKSIEGVKYGSAARSAMAEAGYFATVAEGLDEKLR